MTEGISETCSSPNRIQWHAIWASGSAAAASKETSLPAAALSRAGGTDVVAGWFVPGWGLQWKGPHAGSKLLTHFPVDVVEASGETFVWGVLVWPVAPAR